MKTQLIQLACSLAAALLLPLAAARADTINVAANAGVGVVVVDGSDGQCSLREAMLVAFGTPDGAECVPIPEPGVLTLSLPAGATFTLPDAPYNGGDGPTGLPDVISAYVIDGHDATITRDTAAGTPRFRLLHVGGNGDLTLRSVTLSHGFTPDGADGINQGNGGNAGNGGGIYNEGTLTLIDCAVSNNASGAGGTGGGSFTAAGNGGNGGNGGGIYSTGSLTILGGSVVGSAAGAGGDGGASLGSDGGIGGAGGSGGGIYVASGSLSITDANISDNATGAGGVGTGTPADADGAYGDGGGLAFVGSASVTIARSTISGNNAYDGGGVVLDGSNATTFIGQSALIGNTAIHNGGGLELKSGTATLGNTTISDNGALTAGGVDVRTGSASLSYVTIAGNQRDGIYLNGGSVTLDHSIVTGDYQACHNPAGTLTSAGYNLDDDGSCGLTQTGDLSGVDPMLGALADHGGPTQTMLPMLGSSVIDAIPAAAATTNVPAGVNAFVDQRGVVRPQLGGSDIGAVEVQPYVSTFVRFGGTDQHTVPGDPFAWPLVVQAKTSDGDAVADLNVNVEIVAPTTDASATCAPNTTDNTGVLLAYCTANIKTGSYTVRLSVPAWRSPSGVTLSQDFRLHNDYTDRIFGSGFEGSALTTMTMAKGQSVADVALTVPHGLLSGRIVPILLVHDANGHRVALVEARRTRGSTRVRSIDYDARGYPAHFGAWHAPASRHLNLHVERQTDAAQTSLQVSPR